MISLDTECTGLDLHHGAKPFLVTTCDEDDEQLWWEWEVDPLAREPVVIYEDLIEIQQVIDDADHVVLQNAKFDVTALQAVFLGRLRWDWSKVHDTLLAGHLLASNQPHDLSSMALTYLGINLDPYESRLEEATKEARRQAANDYPGWQLAKKGLLSMPSAKEKVWKYDSWLPRAVAQGKKYLTTHPWWTVCSDYGNADSAATLLLFLRQRELLKERGLCRIYLERLKVLPVVYKMEERGITISRKRLQELRVDYQVKSDKASRICTNIASSYAYKLELPKGANNKSLTDFMLGLPCKSCGGEGYVVRARGVKASCPKCTGKGRSGLLNLPVLKRSKKTGKPSLNKLVMEEYENSLPKRSKQLTFVRTLRGKRKEDTGITYMDGYKKFWLLNDPQSYRQALTYMGKPEWFRLHPSLNPTGTDTLRWSSSNPNEQNISKQEGFNLRYCFGPAPGREWWSLDAKNIELRIPAYETGEEEMIDLFEREDEGPYYGNYHMLIFDMLHPKRFKKHGMDCKKLFESTWYQWVKNGDFAVQYGSIAQSGTADRAYHVPGAFGQIKKRFKRIHGPGGLNDQQIAYAQKHGYVETMPDRAVDSKRGYPLLCSRSKWGDIIPTVPLNYHVQGTAMWWMMKAMIRCQAYLDDYNENRKLEYRAYMVLQVHDELVFDFPKSKVDPTTVKNWKADKFNYLRTNLPALRSIQRLMEQGGDDIGVPTPVGIEYYPKTWSEGVTV